MPEPPSSTADAPEAPPPGASEPTRDTRATTLRLDARSSLRIDAMRLPMTLGIVTIHAYSKPLVVDGEVIGASQIGEVAALVQYYFSQVLARLSVPVFFGIAGYLFFASWAPTLSTYLAKCRSRARTVLVPFLIWNGLLIAVTAAAQSSAALAPLFSGAKTLVADWTLFDFFNELLGLRKNPIAYQFWFLRDLMLVMLAAPLVFAIARLRTPLVPIGIALVWLSSTWPLGIPRDLAVCFFAFGAWMARNDVRFDAFDRHRSALVASYVVLSLADLATRLEPWHEPVHRVGVLVGAMAALALSAGLARESIARQAAWMAPASLFVFASHEPLLTLTKKLGLRLLPAGNDVAAIAFYFADIALVFAFCLAVYGVARRLVPGVVGVLVGGR